MRTSNSRSGWSVFGIILLGLFIFLRSDPLTSSVEKNIYDYYTESIVVDHDLNVINQVPPKDRWQITRTGNYPDVHSNGIVNFWFPFFVYKHWLQPPMEPEHAIYLARTLANAFFAILSLIAMLYWLRRGVGVRTPPLETTLFFLGTSFFFYAITQPGNVDITSSLVACGELLFFSHLAKAPRPRDYFLFGLLAGVGLALKIDHLFYAPLIVYLLIDFYRRDRAKWETGKRALLFGAGAAINGVLLVVNDNLKYGYVDYGYRQAWSTEYYRLWENLFYPSGFLNNNPIFIFSFLGLAWLFFDRKRNAAGIAMGVVPILSVVVESFARGHQESYGSRHWTAYLPVLLLMYLTFMERVRTHPRLRPFRPVVLILCGLAVLQNFYKAIAWILDYERFFNGLMRVGDVTEYLGRLGLVGILESCFRFPLLEWKLRYFSPVIILSLAIAGASYWFFVEQGKGAMRWVRGAAIFWTLTYVTITFLNVANNRAHFLAFQAAGNLKQAVVGEGPHINSLFENLGVLEKFGRFYEINGQPEVAARFKQFRAEYIQRAAREIGQDPVGFRERLLRDGGPSVMDPLRAD